MLESHANQLNRLTYEDKEVILLGTAHVSKESVKLVKWVIEKENPDTVCIELCPSRYQAIRQRDRWQQMDIIKVIKEKKAFLLLANLLLASFQRRIARKFDIKPGQEMIQAVESAEAMGAEICLADRDIRITLSRIWRKMGIWSKFKLLLSVVVSVGEIEDISEADIEKMKETDVLQSLLSEVSRSMPVLRKILIDERDQYLAYRIKTAPGKKIVAVVGAGHVPGIKKYWTETIDIHGLEQLPARRKTIRAVKWMFPLLIVALILFGFHRGGSTAGRQMITWWVLANGILAGLGALMAMAHPLTILSSVLAAPLTSLNPMIAAGWVSGLVEALSRKPKVKDLESLSEDILSAKGFWRNKITRILLVVVFTNLGSSIGTFVAIPLMTRVL
ncbi:MAG: TraB/GumN family protein [Deltaproteobacteria bacterium]|nr:TraB/GumN family protein [Deltaproteobacteria bacterium]